MATPDGFYLFTYDHNHILLLDPFAVLLDFTKTSMRNFLRWAVLLTAFDYTVFILSGRQCLGRSPGEMVGTKIFHRLVHIQVIPSSSSSEFDWPSCEYIKTAQSQYVNFRPLESIQKAGRRETRRNQFGFI